MIKHLDLEKAVDYLIDKTPEGAPFRDGKVFVRGDFFELIVDPTHPLNGQVFRVVRTDRNDAGEATVIFPPESPSAPDRKIQAKLCRLSDRKYLDPQERRRRFALPFIMRECADGTRKARGQRRGSADWEDIPNTDFNGSEIGDYTSDLINTPDGMPKNRDNEVVIWRQVMVSVPGGANEGKTAEPGETKSQPARKRGGGLKRGPWFRKLKNYLTWRKREIEDLDFALLNDICHDARVYLSNDNVVGVPKSRTALEGAVKAALKELGVTR